LFDIAKMGFRVRERLVEAGCCCRSDQCRRGHSKSNGVFAIGILGVSARGANRSNPSNNAIITIRAIYNVRKTEFTWALVAFAGVVILGTLQGIVAAIAVSLVALAYQNADPPVYELRCKPGTNVFRPRSPENSEDEAFPGLLLLRMEGRVFFANAGQIGQKINSLLITRRRAWSL
jgi:hypothetical protein